MGGSAAKSKVITTATAKCCDIGWEEDDWMDVVGNERLNSTRPPPSNSGSGNCKRIADPNEQRYFRVAGDEEQMYISNN